MMTIKDVHNDSGLKMFDRQDLFEYIERQRDLGYKWPEVPSVPRHKARRETDVNGNRYWYGAPPVCPVCGSHSQKKVHPNSDRFVVRYQANSCGFHCQLCRVWWKDSFYVTCYTCDTTYYKFIPILYHKNQIRFDLKDSPCCDECTPDVINFFSRRVRLIDPMIKEQNLNDIK